MDEESGSGARAPGAAGGSEDGIEIGAGRIRLRSTTPRDRSRLVAIRSTEDVRRWWRGGDLDAEFTEDLEDDDLTLLTIERLDGEIIGLIQFAEEEDPDYRSASIDIYLDPVVHRQGLGSEAIQTLADYLFDVRGHHRLTIDPSNDNSAAITCYTKVGFKPVGVMRRYERLADGVWADGLLMDMVKEDRLIPEV